MTIRTPRSFLTALSPQSSPTTACATGPLPAELPARGWTRRTWLATTTAVVPALAVGNQRALAAPSHRPAAADAGRVQARRMAHATPLDPGPVQVFAQRAVEAAKAAGASYVDARFTRSVQQHYDVGAGEMLMEFEFVGCGVRVLVEGCWGFASAPAWLSESNTSELVVALARDAVAQARMAASAKLPRTPVELSPVPVVTGMWATPCRIDPFRVSIEEKYDTMKFWGQHARRCGMVIVAPQSQLDFIRQERVVATSAGSLFTQTCYETGGLILVGPSPDGLQLTGPSYPILGVEIAGQGWERLLDAKIPEQIEALSTRKPESASPIQIGRYTLVCDGSTMASVIGETLGVATQVDRALGYEANAGGTSFLNDPLAMLGSFPVASPLVTVTANRSAPTQLATVQWDDEGVVPREATLVKHGVLTDFQTTREQASWLAPYYTKTGRSVVSNGYAGSQDGQHVPMQMRPNLALAPSPTSVRLDDLISTVKTGMLLEGCEMQHVDFQARNGVLSGGRMRQIVNGKLGRLVGGGTTGVLVNTLQLLKQIKAVGDASTTGTFSLSQYDIWRSFDELGSDKGNPPQRTSYSAQGVAALIQDQAIVNLTRKA